MPPNCGGTVKWIAFGAESDLVIPFWPATHQAETRYVCVLSILDSVFLLLLQFLEFPIGPAET